MPTNTSSPKSSNALGTAFAFMAGGAALFALGLLSHGNPFLMIPGAALAGVGCAAALVTWFRFVRG